MNQSEYKPALQQFFEYNLGKIIDKNRISACYVESGIDATAGCADLKRK